MSRSKVVLFVLLLLVPGALAYNGETHTTPSGAGDPTAPTHQTPAPAPSEAPVAPAPEDDQNLPSGYTGPGSEPYRNYFEGTWIYGQAAATPLASQIPIDMDVQGDWAVWEDAARSDIYVFSLSAGQGYYLTNDSFQQHRPRISHGIVVWEDFRAANRSLVWMYDLANSESRRVSTVGIDIARPQTDGSIVVWTATGGATTDIRAYDLSNSTEWVVAGTPDREQDGFVVDRKVFWRALRFNVWDVLGQDLRTGEPIIATTDRYIQSAPFGNSTAAYYLSQSNLGSWSLDYYDPVEARNVRTPYSMPSSRLPSLSKDHLLVIARDVRYQQLVVRNITNGVATHVTGNLLLATDPVIENDHIYAIVRTSKGTRFLDITVSPFAFAPPPTLAVLSDTSFPWIQPLMVSGILNAGPAWTTPLTFTYRVNGGPPQPIPARTNWAFTLDNTGIPEGYHVITIRATFREGPPVTQTFQLMTPRAFKGVDLPKAADAYHVAVATGLAKFYVLDNPGAWVLIPLVLVLLVILLIRFILWTRRRGPSRKFRRKREPEYVRPDDG